MIFRLYRRGILTDDDEVALAHSPLQLGFSPLTVPMINIRATLNRMGRYHQVSRCEGLDILHVAKQLHFTQRSVENILLRAIPNVPTRREELRAAFTKFYIDLKYHDYLDLLRKLPTPVSASRNLPKWEEIVTIKWVPQFETGIGDLPPLVQW